MNLLWVHSSMSLFNQHQLAASHAKMYVQNMLASSTSLLLRLPKHNLCDVLLKCDGMQEELLLHCKTDELDDEWFQVAVFQPQGMEDNSRSVMAFVHRQPQL